MARAGRKTKLTKDMHVEIVRYLEGGIHPETVCGLAGITKQTFYEWMRRGRDAKSGIYHNFLTDVKRAVSKAESRLVVGITKAGENNWTALAWMLERRFPRRWRKRESRELTGKDGGPIQTTDVTWVAEFADDGSIVTRKEGESGADTSS